VVGGSDHASYRVPGSVRVRAFYMRMVVGLGLGNVGVMQSDGRRETYVAPVVPTQPIN
jgi:hypothetical protein